MSELDRAAVDRLAAAAGLGSVRQLTPLIGGANNRVFRLETENREAVLKVYFRDPADPRDRLGAEFAFSRFAWSVGVRCIPQPLACDVEAGLGLFEFVAGRIVTEAAECLIEQAAEFVCELNANRWKPLASRLPVASEACFSIAEHLGTVARRVNRLAHIPALADFTRELFPAWEEVRAGVSDTAVSLTLTERCVSPSDFGFHNAILERNNRVRFLDFEYAGWDDPAKLICDFFCQPSVPVPLRFFEEFANTVAASFPQPQAVIERARLLLPVYRIKWVCIRLNEFLPTENRRRRFSLNADEVETRQARQLEAARAALHDLQEATS